MGNEYAAADGLVRRFMVPIVGAIAGAAYVIAVELTGQKGGLVYWLAPVLLGAALASPLGGAPSFGALAGFFVAGIAMLGVFGHLNLLPFAMLFFLLPTAFFGVGIFGGSSLRRKLASRE